jgi:hypothetical protein
MKYKVYNRNGYYPFDAVLCGRGSEFSNEFSNKNDVNSKHQIFPRSKLWDRDSHGESIACYIYHVVTNKQLLTKNKN